MKKKWQYESTKNSCIPARGTTFNRHAFYQILQNRLHMGHLPVFNLKNKKIMKFGTFLTVKYYCRFLLVCLVSRLGFIFSFFPFVFVFILIFSFSFLCVSLVFKKMLWEIFINTAHMFYLEKRKNIQLGSIRVLFVCFLFFVLSFVQWL